MDVLSPRHAETIERVILQETNFQRYSAELGWTNYEGRRAGLYEINSQGLRGNRTYEREASPELLRICAFGDSFTFGDEVILSDSWAAMIESISSSVEVLNFGVSSYGLDQSYLRFQHDGLRFQCHVVLIGYMSENIYRNINRYRPFYYPDTGVPLGKPRFDLQGNRLKLISNPMEDLEDYRALLHRPQEVLRRIGVGDYYYENGYTRSFADWLATVRLSKMFTLAVRVRLSPDRVTANDVYNRNSRAFAVTKQIFREFYGHAQSTGAIPLILIFPNREDVARAEQRLVPRYQPLVETLRTGQLEFIDLGPLFSGLADRHSIDELFGGTHYSPLANRYVAGFLLEYVRDAFPQYRDLLAGPENL